MRAQVRILVLVLIGVIHLLGRLFEVMWTKLVSLILEHQGGTVIAWKKSASVLVLDKSPTNHLHCEF